MPRRSDKRDRLVTAAAALIHRQGYHRTTLADIAKDADVPLGNVYYYFKTKDDICEAVIEQRAETLRQTLDAIEAEDPDPKARLIAFLDRAFPPPEEIARAGSPIGSLAQELDKQRGPLSEQVGEILQEEIDWVREQFTRLDRDDAKALGLDLLAALQGIMLLGNALNSAETCAAQTERLKLWIGSL